MTMLKFVIILSAVFLLVSEAKLDDNLKYNNILKEKTARSLILANQNIVNDIKNKWMKLKLTKDIFVDIPENKVPIIFGHHILDNIETEQFNRIRRSYKKMLLFLGNSENLPSARQEIRDDILAKVSMDQKEITEKMITYAVTRGADVTDCLVQFNDLSIRETQANLNITLCNRFERIIANAYVAAVTFNLESKLREHEYIKGRLYRCSDNFDINSENIEANTTEKCAIELQKAEDRVAGIERQIPEILESTMKTIEAQLDEATMLRFVHCNVEDRLDSFEKNSVADLINIQSCIKEKIKVLLFKGDAISLNARKSVMFQKLF